MLYLVRQAFRFATFLEFPFDEIRCFVGARLDGAMGSSIAIPSYDIWRGCTFAHMVYNVVGRVFTSVFLNFFATFCVVTDCTVLGFVSCSSDIRSNTSSSITASYG